MSGPVGDWQCLLFDFLRMDFVLVRGMGEAGAGGVCVLRGRGGGVVSAATKGKMPTMYFTSHLVYC